MKHRIIIAVGRDFNDFDLLEKEVSEYIKNMDLDNLVIVSGKAKGADKLGEGFANNNGFDVKEFPADWKNLDVKPCKVKYNRYGAYNSLAGFNRNEKYGEVCESS